MRYDPYPKKEALRLESSTYAAINRVISKKFGLATLWTEEDGEMKLISAGADVYDAIGTQATMQALVGGNDVVCVTEGWAAPNDGAPIDCPPSEHPDRVRVKLLILFGIGKFTSMMRFGDGGEVHFTDHQSSSGELKDCVSHYVNLATAMRN